MTRPRRRPNRWVWSKHFVKLLQNYPVAKGGKRPNRTPSPPDRIEVGIQGSAALPRGNFVC